MKQNPVPRDVIVKPKEGEKPMPLELLEKEIVELSKAGRQLMSSRLTQRAVLVLLNDYTGLPMGTIKEVLEALPQLEKRYLK